jgi:hypothetical protein
MFVNVESKKNLKVTTLPRGPIDKEAFAESPWQLLSATLGTNFPSSGVPSLPSVVARGARQRKFFLKK